MSLLTARRPWYPWLLGRRDSQRPQRPHLCQVCVGPKVLVTRPGEGGSPGWSQLLPPTGWKKSCKERCTTTTSRWAALPPLPTKRRPGEQQVGRTAVLPVRGAGQFASTLLPGIQGSTELFRHGVRESLKPSALLASQSRALPLSSGLQPSCLWNAVTCPWFLPSGSGLCNAPVHRPPWLLVPYLPSQKLRSAAAI